MKDKPFEKPFAEVRWVAGIAFLSVLAIILGLIAGHQFLGISRDYPNYLEFFELVRSSDGLFSIDTRFEFGFAALVYWLACLGLSNVAIYGAICALCIMLKGAAIRDSELTLGFIAMLVFFYLSRYFILFEMTVLRASIAFAIAFFVFWRKDERRLKAGEFLLLCIAVTFHYSAIVLLAVYLLGRMPFRASVWVIIGIFVVGVLFRQALFAEFQSFFPVLATYLDVEVSTTIVPLPFMLDMALMAAALYLWRENDVAMQYAVIGMLMSVAVHFSMLEFPIIAARFRELLSVFVLIYILKAFRSESRVIKLLAVAFALGSGMLNLYAMTVYDPLLLG
ncbi:EpsG family protein [Cupriavidus campinensis]